MHCLSLQVNIRMACCSLKLLHFTQQPSPSFDKHLHTGRCWLIEPVLHCISVWVTGAACELLCIHVSRVVITDNHHGSCVMQMRHFANWWIVVLVKNRLDITFDKYHVAPSLLTTSDYFLSLSMTFPMCWIYRRAIMCRFGTLTHQSCGHLDSVSRS